jgi:hypothetical protein
LTSLIKHGETYEKYSKSKVMDFKAAVEDVVLLLVGRRLILGRLATAAMAIVATPLAQAGVTYVHQQLMLSNTSNKVISR